MSHVFRARFPGRRCGSCDVRIEVDDDVRYDDDELVHARCAAPVADGQVDLTKVCPDCWLVHKGECP